VHGPGLTEPLGRQAAKLRRDARVTQRPGPAPFWSASGRPGSRSSGTRGLAVSLGAELPSGRVRYLPDERCRRRIARQLNKGENLYALRCTLAYAGEGTVRRHSEQQSEQMWCLTLATNAITAGAPGTTASARPFCAATEGVSTTKPRAHLAAPPMRTCTSTPRTSSISTASWASWTLTATGRFALRGREVDPGAGDTIVTGAGLRPGQH
jgi:Tn3 transposase DDE domain